MAVRVVKSPPKTLANQPKPKQPDPWASVHKKPTPPATPKKAG